MKSLANARGPCPRAFGRAFAAREFIRYGRRGTKQNFVRIGPYDRAMDRRDNGKMDIGRDPPHLLMGLRPEDLDAQKTAKMATQQWAHGEDKHFHHVSFRACSSDGPRIGAPAAQISIASRTGASLPDLVAEVCHMNASPTMGVPVGRMRAMISTANKRLGRKADPCEISTRLRSSQKFSLLNEWACMSFLCQRLGSHARRSILKCSSLSKEFVEHAP
eukprot:7341024-Pyramimonas_sp.AAC.1